MKRIIIDYDNQKYFIVKPKHPTKETIHVLRSIVQHTEEVNKNEHKRQDS